MSDWKADKQQLVQLAEELERRGWQANERGDVQCYDQACAMAAELARDRLNGDTIQLSRAEYEALRKDAERWRIVRDDWLDDEDAKMAEEYADAEIKHRAAINMPANGEGMRDDATR